MTTREERLLELLERWHDARQRGEALSVEELCAGSPALEGDLRRHIATGQWLDRLAGTEEEVPGRQSTGDYSPSTQGPVPVRSTHEPAWGGTPAIPGHEGLQWLGGGGMGTVYRARNVKLGREVALKVVRSEHLSPVLLTRLLAEARAVARLDHPHIVKVYEVGEHRPAGGGPAEPYIALELVGGGSLEQRLHEQTLAPAEAARLVMLLARAVQHAHEKGVVHRDLKPANVLLAPPADEPALNTALGCPKVTDFGLARQLDAQSSLTQTGAVLGTPAYMAPEQAEGRPDVGPAADVWALGAILYRLLAGRVPFEGDTTVDVLYRVRHQPAAPPRESRPDVPAALEEICLRCLQKQPADRYPSAGALADDLRRYLDRPAGGPAPVAAPRRKRRRLAAAAALLLAAGGLAGWWGWKAGRPLPADETLKGSIDVVMSRPGDPLRRQARLNNPAARPLRAGDEVQVEVKLNRPAYVYVLWIDTEGNVGPVYPWLEGEWKRRREERPTRELLLPLEHSGEPPPGGWEGPPVYRVVAGPAGMETLLLLARATPLPQDVDLAKALSGLGAQKREREEDLGEVAWFENGRVVKDERERAANLKATEVATSPVLRLQQALRQRLGGQFEYTRAVTFGNKGGK